MSFKTEYEKMLAGELYDASDPQVMEMRVNVKTWMQQYNQTAFDKPLREKMLK